VEREKRGKRSSYDVLRLPRIGKKGANKKTKQYICWRICAGNVLEQTNKPAAMCLAYSHRIDRTDLITFFKHPTY